MVQSPSMPAAASTQICRLSVLPILKLLTCGVELKLTVATDRGFTKAIDDLVTICRKALGQLNRAGHHRSFIGVIGIVVAVGLALRVQPVGKVSATIIKLKETNSNWAERDLVLFIIPPKMPNQLLPSCPQVL